jgi:tungstate transport system substrate-binding protein
MKPRDLRRGAFVGALSILVPLPASATGPETIVLASTTSLQDSGLLTHILPQFTARTGIEVRVVAQGTGQALATAAHGDADLVLVHDPDAEAAFMAAGHGITRTEIAWNDFIVVGPDADPAHVAGDADVVKAFTKIAETKSPFVSRGDKSGTDAKEKRLWRAAAVSPEGSWYREIGGGMGAALNAANAMNAYTLSDRGTWLSYGHKTGMKIVLQGDRRLLNFYDVILLNPRTHPEAKQTAAHSLADWLASVDGQTAIVNYTMNGQKLFHSEADPKP